MSSLTTTANIAHRRYFDRVLDVEDVESPSRRGKLRAQVALIRLRISLVSVDEFGRNLVQKHTKESETRLDVGSSGDPLEPAQRYWRRRR